MNSKGKNKIYSAWEVLKGTIRLFWRQDTSTLASSLSYYTIFAIAPVIIIVIAIAGLILGPQAVQGEISNQIQGVLGAKSAAMVEGMIKAAYRPGQNVPAAIIAVTVLIIGAIAVFGQLRTSLNTIWEVKEQGKKPVLQFILTRLFSFAMVVTLAFLLLISLAIHTGLEAFSNYLQRRLPDISILLFQSMNLVFSIGLTWLLFALIYKFLSDAHLKWRSVWWGALFTAVLFSVGKFLIGLYLGHSDVADTYGAAGSVVVILIWVFYSSQILFFGAEFTRALAEYRGDELNTPIQPASRSVNKK